MEATQETTSTILTKRKTQFLDPFSEEVFFQTYRFGQEKDVNERHFLVAENLASVEKPELRSFWTQKFLDLLENFKFVPGGRITSNAGTGLRGTTYINCFVSGFRGEDQDSMNSILDELKRQALILKSEGGYGFCANVMRPRGAYIEGIGGESPGAVKLLDMWDTQSSVITAGSGRAKTHAKGKNKIRKGAQMVTMSVWHPDIEEFILAKQVPGRLTKFNMSVLVSDAFMHAVENHRPWSLIFPDHESAPEAYAKKWDGNLDLWISEGLPTRTYKIFDDANELWDLIMKSTYNRNEPGVLFVDTINRWNNLYYAEYIQATNPCGEQVLPVGGVCLLGSLNLTQFVNSSRTGWDFEALARHIPVAVRFMDNVNDITQVPLSENRENLLGKRRIGLGVLGYASALMMMRVRYGSNKALELTEELCEFMTNEAYAASAELAKEKGPFSLFDREKYLNGAFIKNLRKSTQDKIRKYGIRNSHLISIQPTGNSSVLANNVSGGLEPIFSSEYIRTVIQPSPPAGLEVPENVNWQDKSFLVTEANRIWHWINEGDENLLRTEWNGDVWKLDATRGLLKESPVMDYAVRLLKSQGEWDESAPWAATASKLKIQDHVKTMGVFSRFVDSAISKTVNLPHEYPYDDFKTLYQTLFRTGTVKGCTTYREGTMASVLAAPAESKNAAEIFAQSKAMPRPQVLPCDIRQVNSNGTSWIVLVGLLEGRPYEVFAMKQTQLYLPQKDKQGRLIKVKSGVYDLETAEGWVLKDIRKFFESDEQEALTRMISTALRHGADIDFVVGQLHKSEGTIHSFSKAIARTLKHYIKNAQFITCTECQSHNMRIEEGCFVCLDCGSSKCM